MLTRLASDVLRYSAPSKAFAPSLVSSVRSGMAALATAILRGLTSPTHLEDLLSRGADVANLSYCDPLGRQLIHLAADSGDISALRWLLSHGADPRAVTEREGNTPLHVASSEGHADAVTYLLEEASVGVAGVNFEGHTAIDVALDGGHDNIARLLTRHLRPLPPPETTSYPLAQKPDQITMSTSTSASPIAGTGGGRSDGSDVDRCGDNLAQASIEPVAAGEQGEGQTGMASSTAGSRHPREGLEAVVAAGVSAGAGRKAGAEARRREAGSKQASISPRRGGTRVRARTPDVDERGITEGGFFVAGAWSKAGMYSCFNIRNENCLGKYGIVFDMGVCPSEVVHAQHIFISHGHMDHCGAVVSHARLRGIHQKPPAKYYMHEQLAKGMEKIRQAFEAVEGGEILMDIVTVGPDDIIELGQGCSVRPFPVQHRVEALGFALVRRKSCGLKPEYRGLPGKALSDLKRRGEDVCFYKESVEVVYTGDTLMKGLLSQPLVWKARLLIMEVTYLDGDRAVALKNFHIHVQDVVDNIEKLEGVGQLLVAHVSERYGRYRNVQRMLMEALPASVINKVSVALGEFDAHNHVSFLEDFVFRATGKNRQSFSPVNTAGPKDA